MADPDRKRSLTQATMLVAVNMIGTAVFLLVAVVQLHKALGGPLSIGQRSSARLLE